MTFEPDDSIENRLHAIRCRMALVLGALELTQNAVVFIGKTNDLLKEAAYTVTVECLDALETIMSDVPADVANWRPEPEPPQQVRKPRGDKRARVAGGVR